MFMYRIVHLPKDGPARLGGTAFAITADGGLLTARHVVDVSDDVTPLVVDTRGGAPKPIEMAVVPDNPELDIAFLPAAAPDGGSHFPLLSPGVLTVGEDVYSYGFYTPHGLLEGSRDGVFKGHIVSFQSEPRGTQTLSYPVVEGLSGAPVLEYHNGTKVVGVCAGSLQQRASASEVLEHESGELKLRETVHRIIEFGLAYRVEDIIAFLEEEGFADLLVVTDGQVDNSELG